MPNFADVKTMRSTPYGCDESDAALPTEPTATLGSIQPYGLLMVVDETDLSIEAASENSAQLIGISALELCGSSFPLLVGLSAETFRSHVATTDTFALSIDSASALNKVFTCTAARRKDGTLLIELEPPVAAASDGGIDLEQFITGLQAASDIDALLEAAALAIRTISGYARVRVERFDGSRERPESALQPTLHMIADTAYVPAELRSRHLQPSAEIDLSRATLRGITPAVRASLRKMGTRALLTIAIVIRGRLWGSIACHHPEPRRLAHADRLACELIGHVLAWRLGSRLDVDERPRRQTTRMAAQIGVALSAGDNVADSIVELAPKIYDLFNADGIAVRIGGTIRRCGRTPSGDAELLALATVMLAGDASSAIATSDRFCEHEASAEREIPAGVLAARLSADGDVLLLFRRGVETGPHVAHSGGHARRWNADDIVAAELIGTQIRARTQTLARRHAEAVTHVNAQLEVLNAQAEALIKLQDDVAAALPSRPAITGVILDFALRETHADGSVIEIQSADTIVLEAAAGMLAELIGVRLSRAGSLSGRSIDLGHSLVCDDTATSARVDRDFCTRYGIGSMLAVPIAISDERTVVLKVVAARTHAFEAGDVQTLEVAATHLQSALRAAHEFTALAAAELEQRTYARQLRALHAIASATTSHRKAQIDAALRLGLEQLDLDWGFLGVVDYATQDFVIESSVSRDGRSVAADGTRMPLGKSIIGRVAIAKEVTIVLDVAALPEHAMYEGWKSYIAVPLFIDGVNYGAIGFTSRHARPEPFSQANIEFLAVAGELIASAIERGRQREQLETSQSRYATLIEAIPQMVWVIDAANSPKYVNARWTDYTGLSLAQSRAAGVASVYNVNDLHSVADGALQLPLTEYDFEIRLRRSDGNFRWHLVRSVPFRSSGGDIDTWLLTGTDIEERKSAEALLADVHDAALAATEAKSRFLASMSHEIRTPMNGVIGMTELLLLTPLNDEQREYIEVVRDSGQSLLRVLNDILDYSKIEAGKLELETAQFDLPSQIESVVELLRPGFTSKAVELTTHIAPGVPAIALGDPGRLRQILLNLAGNALKFTPAGGSVTIDVAAAPPDGDVVPVRFTITDTGIGIPSHVVGRLFQPFSQGDESTTRKYGGTGLGLSISGELVSLMGGEIGVESVPDVGSKFWFAIPFNCVQTSATILAAPKRARAKPEPTALRTEKLLLVEDNEINTFLALKQLRRLGFIATAVANGREAVAAVQRERFDLLLMDCHMPEMDGFEATREIRRLRAGQLPHLPIVAMTADARDEDHQNCLQAGMDDYISKPTNLDSLRAVLDRRLPAPERRRASRTALPLDSTPLIGMTMLLNLFDGDREAVLDLLAAAQRSIEADCARIGHAAAERDWPTVIEAAHRLKGTSGSIRSSRLVEIGAAIETEAKSGVTRLSGRLLSDLRQAVSTVAAEIQRRSPGADSDVSSLY